MTKLFSIHISFNEIFVSRAKKFPFCFVLFFARDLFLFLSDEDNRKQEVCDFLNKRRRSNTGRAGTLLKAIFSLAHIVIGGLSECPCMLVYREDYRRVS